MRDSRNPDATAAIRRGTGRPVAAVVLLALFEIAAVAGSPNLFIFKHEIMYIAEDTGRRAR